MQIIRCKVSRLEKKKSSLSHLKWLEKWKMQQDGIISIKYLQHSRELLHSMTIEIFQIDCIALYSQFFIFYTTHKWLLINRTTAHSNETQFNTIIRCYAISGFTITLFVLLTNPFVFIIFATAFRKYQTKHKFKKEL